MLKMKDILDEKDERLRIVSKEVEFPLTKKDKDTIKSMLEYLRNSQIEELSEKYDLRPGMGLAAPQVGINKNYFVVVHEVDEQVFDNYVIINPKIVGKNLGMHPILTLVFIYLGYSLFGIVGLILVPVLTVLVNVAFGKEDTAEVTDSTVAKGNDG